ncbi:MAG TPA: sugar ABC transporter permease [Aggregatilineales bacterium]|nr:sugar ABC transporter permease [Anaerolineales bacterium]HRE46527.1 sugar ABC transporter permease [Aggregatilineales bacterium]
MSQLASRLFASRTLTGEKPYRTGRFWEKNAPYVFVAPFFLAFLAFQLFPIGFSVFLSLHRWDPYADAGKSFIPLDGVFDNFTNLFNDARFWNSVGVTLRITLFCAVIGAALAVLIAVLIDRMPDWLGGIFRATFFLPAVTSVVVIAYLWRQLLNTNYGPVNGLLVALGGERADFLGGTNAIWALNVMLIWSGLGWDVLIVSSALRNIPTEYYEAARLDGANENQLFFRITLPLLQNVLFFIMTTGVIFLLGIFVQPALLVPNDPRHRVETIARYLYDRAFSKQEFGYASAIAITLTLMMFVASFINTRFFKGGTTHD